MQLKFFSNYKESAIFKTLLDNNIKIDEETIVTFTDSSWNDCIDTGRSTGGNCTIVQGGVHEHINSM